MGIFKKGNKCVEIVRQPKFNFEKEEPAAWIDRLFGEEGVVSFEVSGEFAKVTTASGGEKSILLPEPRLRLLAWIQNSLSKKEERDLIPGDGVAVLICDELNSQFLLTRKGQHHPNPKCRGMLCMVSGSIDKGEDPVTAAKRELYEEIRDTRLADQISEVMTRKAVMTLPAVQWPGFYRLVVYVAKANPVQFRYWRKIWEGESLLSEADPVVICNAATMHHPSISTLLESEALQPGSTFVASHGEAIMTALKI